MGEVWLAEQKQPVRRRVALKLIKAGMDSREIVLRFESERQALALMDHPAIAKVYDAGTTSQGGPYFVMEYVAGVPISEFCDTHRLPMRERLELFIHVCEGVQHAHQKAIIHRDLKPSNILVSEVDGRPAPKIIDFGVAKALSQRLTDQTMFTRVGSIVGTPEYMSPEQASSGGEDIDTRSDVYSLGVILFELLVGVRPLDFSKSTYFELVRKLREEDTPKPSTRSRSLGGDTTLTARNRRVEPSALTKQLRGDLDCITLKCLEKDRARRYGSPSELSADITRYLENQPVLATSPSTFYRFRKFSQRNRTLLFSIAALALVLVAGTVISLVQAARAKKAERAATVQRDRADSEMARAEAISDFLQNDLLAQAGADGQQDPDATPDPNVKVRTLVDRAAAKVGKKLAGKSSLEAELRITLGNTYRSLGLMPEAEQQLRIGYELSKTSLGADSPQTLDALQDLAALESDGGKLIEATRHSEIAFEGERRLRGPDARETIVAMQGLAVEYLNAGKTAQAEPLLLRALQAQIKSPGYDNPRTLDTSDSLVALYLQTGRFDEAEKLLERGLLSYRKVYGPEHPNTQRELFGLVRVMYSRGEYERAEPLAYSVNESNRRLLGQDHFKTLSSSQMLAKIYLEEGKTAQALSLVLNNVSRYTRTLGDTSRETLIALELLAAVYERDRNYSKAEPLLRQVVNGFGTGASQDAIFANQLPGK